MYISGNKKAEEHYSFTPEYKYGYIPDVPLCDKEWKKLDKNKVLLTKELKAIKCNECRRLLAITLKIKIYPRGTSRGYANRWNHKQKRLNRKQRQTGIPNWKRFKSHKNESEIKLHAVK